MQSVQSTKGEFRNDAEIKTDGKDHSVFYIDGQKFSVSGIRLAVHIYAELAAGKSKGGIIITSASGKKDALDAPVGKVIAMGPDAYKETAFKQPYCAIDDWVVFPRNLTNRLNWEDKAQVVYINDTDIIGTVPYPEGIKKAIPINYF